MDSQKERTVSERMHKPKGEKKKSGLLGLELLSLAVNVKVGSVMNKGHYKQWRKFISIQ